MSQHTKIHNKIDKDQKEFNAGCPNDMKLTLELNKIQNLEATSFFDQFIDKEIYPKTKEMNRIYHFSNKYVNPWINPSSLNPFINKEITSDTN